jgi:hypothetical protein
MPGPWRRRCLSHRTSAQLMRRSSRWATHDISTQGQRVTALNARMERSIGAGWQLKALGSSLAFNWLYLATYGQGLMDFLDGPPAAPPGRTAAVSVAAIVLSVYVFPLIGSATARLLEWSFGCLCRVVERSPRAATAHPQPGFVPLREARNAALYERDGYWTERIEQELSAQAERRSTRTELQLHSFAVLSLLVLDLCCTPSLIEGFLRLFGLEATRDWLGVAYLALSLVWCGLVVRHPGRTLGYIRHPALAEKLARTRKPYGASHLRPMRG